MSLKTPQRITVEHNTYSMYDLLSGTITDVKARFDLVLGDVRERFPTFDLQERDITIDTETEYGSYGDSDREVITVHVQRLETEVEVQSRMAKRRTAARVKKAVADAKIVEDVLGERLEYERLKKIYG